MNIEEWRKSIFEPVTVAYPAWWAKDFYGDEYERCAVDITGREPCEYNYLVLPQ